MEAGMPPGLGKKHMKIQTATNIAKAYAMRNAGHSFSEIGEALGKSVSTVGFYLQSEAVAQRLGQLYELGQDVFKEHYQSAVNGAKYDDDNPPPASSTTLESDAPDYPGFEFLYGEQAAAWFRAIEAGADVWIAADAAEIDRKMPIEWLRKARDGDSECLAWAQASRRFSAMAFLKLRERLAEAPASWRGLTEAAATIQHFDASEEGRNPIEEVREMLTQVLAETD